MTVFGPKIPILRGFDKSTFVGSKTVIFDPPLTGLTSTNDFFGKCSNCIRSNLAKISPFSQTDKALRERNAPKLPKNDHFFDTP